MEKDRITEAYDEIDLYNFLQVILRRKWMITIGVIVATLAAIPTSYMLRRYESMAVLKLSDELKTQEPTSKYQKKNVETIVTLPEYKIYSAAFMDSQAFLKSLKSNKSVPLKETAYIEKKLKAEPLLEDHITPIYAYAEKETKAFSPKQQFISAVQLSWEDPSPKLAQSLVRHIGLFVRKSLEHKLMERYVTRGYQEAYALVHELENMLVDLRFSLKQNEKKLADLKKISQRSPQAAQPTIREVVSVDKGGHRYLPPPTQMVATQVAITDTTLDINDSERDLKINRTKLELFTILKQALETGSENLLEHLSGIKNDFFQKKDLNKDEILIVRNDVFADFAQFEYWFRDVIQFVSGPTLPEKAKPSKILVATCTFFVGLFFFIILAFFLEFIKRGNRQEG